MNFRCECGHRIHDNTDYLPYKGYFLADQDQDDLMDEIDDAIEKSGPTPRDKEEAAMRIRSLITRLFKSAYQCSNCGNLFMDLGPAGLEMFRAVDPVNKNLLRSALGSSGGGMYLENGRTSCLNGKLPMASCTMRPMSAVQAENRRGMDIIAIGKPWNGTIISYLMNSRTGMLYVTANWKRTGP